MQGAATRCAMTSVIKPGERETCCETIALICTYYNDTSGGDSGQKIGGASPMWSFGSPVSVFFMYVLNDYRKE